MEKIQEEDVDKKKISTLYKWLSKGKVINTKLSVKICSPGCRTVISDKPIKKGQIIVFVPKNMMITLESIEETPLIQKIRQSQIKLNSPKHSLLSMYLLEQKKAQNSFFKPYIDSLPESCDTFPIFYSPQELKELQGSPLLQSIHTKKFEIQLDYNMLIELKVGFDFSYDEFCWARMIICSRIFGIEIGDTKTDALVPLADMLNHGSNKQTSWSYCNKKQGFEIKSNQNIGKGIQIFDSYGRKSNWRFLMNYGFTMEDNQADELTIRLKLNRNTKNKLLEICEQDPCRFPYRLGCYFKYSDIQELLSTIRFILDIESQQQLPSSQQQSNKTMFRQAGRVFTTLQNQLKCWHYVRNLLIQTLADYPTTLEQDLEKLEKQDLSYNISNCVKLRIGEKRIIYDYLQICDRMQILFQNKGNNYKKNCLKKENKEFDDYLFKISSFLE